jgi:urea transport system ATP-binding protein
VPEAVFELFPVLKDMLRRRGGDLSGGQQQQLAIARALVARPRLLLLDEPTEGIQPSIVKQIGEVISRLAAGGEMAILLIEQYLDFARAVADDLLVMDRGQVVVAGAKRDVDEDELRRYLTVYAPCRGGRSWT